MKVCVFGLWHLGSVTAACLAKSGIETVGLAESPEEAERLSSCTLPLFEPGLEELIKSGISNGNLSFTSDQISALHGASVVWVTYDTPINEDDMADVGFVMDQVVSLFPHLDTGTVVLISSQLPVGSTAKLEARYSQDRPGVHVHFCYSPENLRLGRAISAFANADRIVIGVRDGDAKTVVEPLLSPFGDSLLWMNVESAEMVKHALNGYLAANVSFTNEVASICEQVNADFREVESALRSDPRIGPKAYVRAGAAFGGGTLARDVQFLIALAKDSQLETPVLGAVLEGNSQHRFWAVRRLSEQLGSLTDKQIGILGLAYKADTDVIRRSIAVDVGLRLADEGANVFAFDPKVRSLPPDYAKAIQVSDKIEKVFLNSDAVLLMTEWPEFRDIPLSDYLKSMRRPLLIDQNGYLESQINGLVETEYLVFGRNL